MGPIENGVLDLAERFVVLSRQESGVYRCKDYLTADHQAMLGQNLPQEIPTSAGVSSSASETSSNSGGINEVWREKICEWTFQVIDHFDFNREIASISLDYLDRYLCTRTVNRKTFQLAAMTSLFLAIKLYEPTALRMSSFIELSRGYFKTEHIAFMESNILWTLSWHVHPPTPLNFVRNFIPLLEQSGCSSSVALEIKEVARFLTELSVCDYYFTTRKPSSIGLGALLTAFDSFDDATLPLRVRERFLDRVHMTGVIDPAAQEVLDCKGRLCETYLQDSGYHQQQSEAVLNDGGRYSPDCVGDIESSYHNSKRHCDRNLRNAVG
eukprot:CAMPEP_0198264542 /NCGR_PEP_ID=MMETSP1447-20131203/16207_1 /TAXON_ID=420782 /ORGANISM="Chaetoceros dichaeta, Strain CCMP1751" /LENGTH=324 /DNA_ID=CAMNT_0043953513 /DNA_START=83 /DNA_END=1057 /DNA_ORIENTATION=-